jgi:hypothetical protein
MRAASCIQAPGVHLRSDLSLRALPGQEHASPCADIGRGRSNTDSSPQTVRLGVFSHANYANWKEEDARPGGYEAIRGLSPGSTICRPQRGFEVPGVRRSVYQNARAPPSHPAMETPECCNSGRPGRGGRVIADRVLPRSLLYRRLVVKTGLLGECPRLKTSSGTDSSRVGRVTILRDSEHQMTLFLFEKPACSAARWLVPKRKC